ncbi:transcription factor Adf-1-like [Eupeodes corollae]|uniref:transcription factor Adf-1-like n=1 Tax=Eupeodes corollae TaxID=290404 RepID=UPI00249111CE|nr:transcription factor Adf-1-like [Eupeodes corollae]
MDECEKIIQAVAERDVLWNLENRNYKNNKIKAKEWEAIAQQLNMPMEFIKKKWRSLRDTYSRAISKKPVSGQAAECDDEEVGGKYSAQMEFLRAHLRHRQTIGNYTPSHYSSEETLTPSPTPLAPVGKTSNKYSEEAPQTSTQAMENYGNNPEPALNSPIQTNVDSEPFLNPPKRRRIEKQQSKIEKTFVNTMMTVQEFLTKLREPPSIILQSPSPSQLTSEDELFCCSLVEKLAKFPIHLRNSSKLEMLRFLNEVELNWIQEGGE